MEWLVKPAFEPGQRESPEALRRKAREFARLAREARDPVASAELRKLVKEYERQAESLEREPEQAKGDESASTSETQAPKRSADAAERDSPFERIGGARSKP